MIDSIINRITGEVVGAVEVVLEQFLNDFTAALGKSVGASHEQLREVADLREAVAVRDKQIRHLEAQK